MPNPMSPEEILGIKPSLGPQMAGNLSQMSGYRPPPAAPAPMPPPPTAAPGPSPLPAGVGASLGPMPPSGPVDLSRVKGAPTLQQLNATEQGISRGTQMAGMQQALNRPGQAVDMTGVRPRPAAVKAEDEAAVAQAIAPAAALATGPAAPAGLSWDQALRQGEQALGYTNVSPEQMRRQAEAGQAVAKDVEEGAEIAARTKASMAGHWIGQAEAEDAARAAQIKADQEHQAVANDMRARIQKTDDEIGNAKVDPQRFWASKSTGERMLMSLGVLLGGIGSAFTGGGNAALKLIESNIDRDVNAQVENRRALNEKRSGQMNAYQMYRQQGLDDTAARISATQAARQQTITKLQALADSSESEQTKNNAKSLIDQLTQKNAAADEERSQLIGATAYKIWAASRLPMGGPVAGGKLLNEETRELSKRMGEAGVPEHGVVGGDLERALTKGGGEIEGTGVWEDLADKVPVVGQFLHSDEARINRANLSKLNLGYQHALTGAGASDHEREMISQAFLGARTAGDVAAAVQMAKRTIAAKEKNIRAGFTDQANATYDARLQERTPTVQATPVR